jgi:hypothetical protein
MSGFLARWRRAVQRRDNLAAQTGQGPECLLCPLDQHLRGTPPLGPPVRLIEIPGVFGLQPVCAEHAAAWEAIDDERR